MGKLLKEGLEKFSQYISWKMINFILRPWFLVLWNNQFIVCFWEICFKRQWGNHKNDFYLSKSFTMLRSTPFLSKNIFIYFFYLFIFLSIYLYILYIYIYIYISFLFFLPYLFFILHLRTDCNWLYLTWVLCLVSSALYII